MADPIDDTPTGWRDPTSLIQRHALQRRYMSDVIPPKGRAPLGSIRSVFKDQENTVLTFLFRTELEQSRGNVGKAVFRRKPPENVRIVPITWEMVNVVFDPVDGAKEYAVELKASGEPHELFEIAWQLKTKRNVQWGTVERGTVKSLMKDPCQKINAIPNDVKKCVWENEDKEKARALWHESWEVWQSHWNDVLTAACDEPPCQVVGIVADSTYIARVMVKTWSSFYTDTTEEWSEPSPKRMTMKPPPPKLHKSLADEQRHLTKEDLERYGGLENYNKKIQSVRSRLKAQAYKLGGGLDVQQIFERIFDVRDTDGSGSIELDEWMIICRKDLNMPRFMLKDWEVEMVFHHVDADKSESIEMDEICAFLDPQHFQLHQDGNRALRRLAQRAKAVLPHRTFEKRQTGKKKTIVLGMPRVKKVRKKKRHRHLEPNRVRVNAAVGRLGAVNAFRDALTPSDSEGPARAASAGS